MESDLKGLSIPRTKLPYRGFEQLRQRLDGLKHRSLDKVVERINGIWKSVEHEAPLDNMEAFLNASV